MDIYWYELKREYNSVTKSVGESFDDLKKEEQRRKISTLHVHINAIKKIVDDKIKNHHGVGYSLNLEEQ
jgi:DNA-binding response OmpR family regulator